MQAQESIKFYAIVFTRDGVKPNPKKIQAFASTSPPTNVSEVGSLFGMPIIALISFLIMQRLQSHYGD